MWGCGQRTPFSWGDSSSSAPHLGAVATRLAGWQVLAELVALVCGTEAGTGGATGLELKGRRAAVLCGRGDTQAGGGPPGVTLHPPIPEHIAPVPSSPREGAGLPPAARRAAQSCPSSTHGTVGTSRFGPWGAWTLCGGWGCGGSGAWQVVQGYRGAEMEGSPHTPLCARGVYKGTKAQLGQQSGKIMAKTQGCGGEEQLRGESS